MKAAKTARVKIVKIFFASIIHYRILLGLLDAFAAVLCVCGNKECVG